ncbi:MAG: alpha/beta fold hydrolase [Mariniphaga sp.]|nr:alpha/beta fold hydrolase [Mariniphaga sp.]
MKKIVKKIIYIISSLVVVLFILGLILAFLPIESKVKNKAVSMEEAATLRQNFTEAHHLFSTSDGEILFLRKWNPDSIETAKKDIAILIFHGITAHSGAYPMAGKIISSGGYTTFGLDYRGHGLSGGNRADSPGKERWIADLTEAVNYIKGLGYPKVIIMGHSLGVAAALYATISIPDEVSGLMLLSGGYEGKKRESTPIPFFQKAKILASSIFRPSKQAVEYYREDMTGANDPLFNFRYTLRFLSMMDVTELILPEHLNIPVLVAVGDKDELFEVDQVKEVYDDVPGNKKEFLVLENTYHATFPDASWEKLVVWLNNNF